MDRIATTWQGCELFEICGATVSLERGELMRLVFEAIDRPGWQHFTSEQSETPAAILRSVVLYCLVTNICSSEEIVESATSNAAVRYLCANHSFDWQMVHDFRRRNAEIISLSLAKVFRSVQPAANSWEEAQTRIRRAIQADSTVLDL